uniref:Uncharacterized protein n=1 Tax=Rhizophora mucronata TaxID=61149 RepID=A0A2P2L967_RHIMU
MDSNGGVEKTEEDLRREIDELLRQQRQINERLRDPRGLRRGGLSAGGPRNSATIGGRHRGFVRPVFVSLIGSSSLRNYYSLLIISAF